MKSAFLSDKVTILSSRTISAAGRKVSTAGYALPGLSALRVLQYVTGMSDNLHFMMGQFRAEIPTDRRYSARHLWLQDHDGVYRVGFTAYSVRLLQDVYFLDWLVDPQTQVKDRQEIGEIESSKAVSAIFTPCGGEIIEFNQSLLNDPAGINADNYGTGWLYTMRTDAPLLSPSEYVKVLEDGWEDTQRTIKGQMN